jgi:hypothetical protein
LQIKTYELRLYILEQNEVQFGGIIINGEEMILDLLLEVVIPDILGQSETNDRVLVDGTYLLLLNGID